MKRSKNAGFSTADIVVALVLMGIMSMVLMFNLTRTKAKGEEKNMRTKAWQLNGAVSGYMAEGSVRAALSNWSGKSDEQRYQLIRKHLEYPRETLEGFMIEGYSIQFDNDPRNPVVLRDPDGNVIDYQ